MSEDDVRRLIPRTDTLVDGTALAGWVDAVGRDRVRTAVQGAQARARAGEIAPGTVAAAAEADLDAAHRHPGGLRPVINATGVVLHTNLGRAPLSADAVRAVADAAGYTDVEYDLAAGVRARRGAGVLTALADAVPTAPAVHVVNNCAAALVLAVAALGDGDRDEVVVSRGELVEIGDGFRLLDLIAATGVTVVEVGSTNRTKAADYLAAVGPRTRCVLKIHPSNFRVQGFTGSVADGELAATLRGLDPISRPPLVVDVGSGLLRPDPLLPDEPDVASALADGADLVLCSADKLFGGPQAGLVFGRTDLVERVRRHPLARAMRVDKLTLAALQATVARYPHTPTMAFLHADAAGLHRRAQRLAAALPPELGASVVAVVGAVGAGGGTGVDLPGWAVALPAAFAAALRGGRPAVIGRIDGGRCLLDLRAVDEDADGVVAAAVARAASALTGAATPPPLPSVTRPPVGG